MIRHFSAGGIVFKEGKVLLINNTSIKDQKESFWGFPKGHIDKGESSKDAALREVEEEAGIKAEIVEKIGDSKYIFTQNKEKIFKVVTVYLMRHISGEPKPQLSEIIELGWYDPEEALNKLTFKNDKDLLKKALEIHE